VLADTQPPEYSTPHAGGSALFGNLSHSNHRGLSRCHCDVCAGTVSQGCDDRDSCRRDVDACVSCHAPAEFGLNVGNHRGDVLRGTQNARLHELAHSGAITGRSDEEVTRVNGVLRVRPVGQQTTHGLTDAFRHTRDQASREGEGACNLGLVEAQRGGGARLMCGSFSA
jgi:hypothetical protein